MYRIGDLLIYGIHGVCRVTDLEKQIINKQESVYLVLEPVEQPGARFLIPTHNEAAMAKLWPVLPAQELETLLRSHQIRRNAWISDENQRKQHYRDMVSRGNRESFLAALYMLYCHKKEQSAIGRKLHICDENFLKDAEKRVAGEISAAMNLDPQESRDYLRRMLSPE